MVAGTTTDLAEVRSKQTLLQTQPLPLPCILTLTMRSALSPCGEQQDKASAVFKAYDVDGKSWLDRKDMMSAFAELGVLHGLTAKSLGELSP